MVAYTVLDNVGTAKAYGRWVRYIPVYYIYGGDWLLGSPEIFSGNQLVDGSSRKEENFPFSVPLGFHRGVCQIVFFGLTLAYHNLRQSIFDRIFLGRQFSQGQLRDNIF